MKKIILAMLVVILAGCAGKDGEQGLPGPVGPSGGQGSQGDTGDTGTPAPTPTVKVYSGYCDSNPYIVMIPEILTADIITGYVNYTGSTLVELPYTQVISGVTYEDVMVIQEDSVYFMTWADGVLYTGDTLLGGEYAVVLIEMGAVLQ